MSEEVKVPSDDELSVIYGKASKYVICSDTDRAKREKGVRAVRVAVEAPWRAEVERLTKERDDLRAKLEEAEKRTVPARVTFDCTDEGVNDYLYSKNFSSVDVTTLTAIMDYLATRARIAVPEGVPTAKELIHEVLGNDIKYPAIQRAFRKTYNRLAPYLRRPVDSALCDTPFDAASPLCNKDRISMSTGDDNLAGIKCIHIREYECAFCPLTPADAARAAEWLLSFAAKHGVAMNVPSVEDMRQDKFSRNLKSFLNEPDEIEPIAAPETLEALVEIAAAEGVRIARQGPVLDSKAYNVAFVSAVLRNAGAYVDVTSGVQLGGTKYSYWLAPEALDYLNSRIRYRVQPPCAECEKCLEYMKKHGEAIRTNFELSKRIAAAKAALEGDAHG